jgi:hypothetical protein
MTMTRQEALSEAQFCVQSAQSVDDPEYRSALMELAEWWNQQAVSSAVTGRQQSRQRRPLDRT